MSAEPIRQVDLAIMPEAHFVRRCADTVVVAQDGKLILKQRPKNWASGGGMLTTFGGEIEPGETPMEALLRELKEELGAEAQPDEIISLGTITEAFTGYTELVYTYFWQDRRGTITGCYECEAASFDDIAAVFAQSNLMDYSRWMLLECQNRKLLR